MNDQYDPLYDSEVIPPPDENFLNNHWQDICLHAAEKHS